MSGINLNDSSFDGGKAIFNGGVAGVADNVTMTVAKKASDDTSRGPDYNIVFTDGAGQTIKRAFWYLDPEAQYYAENIARDGKVFKHVLKLLMGENFVFPEYQDAKAMLDGCMKLINDNCANKSFAIFCNYGSASKPNQYLNVRNFVPFITKAGQAESLVATPYDNMDRPQASQAVAESAYADDTASGNDAW